jgi:hypothetical protein
MNTIATATFLLHCPEAGAIIYSSHQEGDTMRETGIHHMSHLDRLEDAADVIFEQKWSLFAQAPYDFLEYEAPNMCPYLLMALALENRAAALGLKYEAPPGTYDEFDQMVRNFVANSEDL